MRKRKKTIVFVVKFNLLLFFIINREYFDTDFAINAKTISTKGKPKSFSIIGMWLVGHYG